MRSDAQPPRSGGGSRTRNFRSISTLSIYPDPASSQQAFDASGRATERDVAASARSLGLAPWFSARDRSRKQSPARRYELPLRARRVSRCSPARHSVPRYSRGDQLALPSERAFARRSGVQVMRRTAVWKAASADPPYPTPQEDTLLSFVPPGYQRTCERHAGPEDVMVASLSLCPEQ